MRRLRERQQGFTLVEVMMALFVFTIVTLGIIPLMAATMRGSDLARSGTAAKNVAVEAMERARGLPYFVSRAAEAANVDLLDLYHPAPPNTTFDGEPYYRVVCTSTSTAAACPRGIGDAYTLTFLTRFVAIADDGSASTVTTPSTYSATSATTDSPPSRLVQLIITADWEFRGADRSFTLESLIADRRFGGTELNGFGRITYGIRVGTLFDSLDLDADLTATFGEAESVIETRREARADQRVAAADATLTDANDPDGADVGTPIAGAVSAASAPPDLDPSARTASSATLAHPTLGGVTGIDSTTAGPTSPLEADVEVVANSAELPLAQGGFSYASGAILDGWVDKPEVQKDALAGLRLLPATPIFSISTDASSIVGWTGGETTALPGGEVETEAHLELPDIEILPTSFAPDGVIRIENFEATTTCTSSAETGIGLGGVAEWSADVSYWQERDDNVSGNGAYTTITGLSQEDATDPLAAVRETNPLVFEDTSDPLTEVDGSAPGDVYLFEQVHEHVIADTGTTITHNHAGYLSRWAANVDEVEDIQADGRVTSAAIEDALTIETAALPVPAASAYTPSPLAVRIASLSCEAVDFR